MNQYPSDLFVSAVRRGYDKALAQHGRVTCSDIWDQMVYECMFRADGFVTMFEWDKRKAKQNRIGTIADCIKAGQVPGLRLVRDEAGREFVEGKGDRQS